MASIRMENILTIVYVLVDDWWEKAGKGWRHEKPGVRPVFKDSEMLTLMLAHEWLPYGGETQYIGYIRANYGALFPQLVDQSQYNRRAKDLGQFLEPLREYWLSDLKINSEALLIDTKPIPVVGFKRDKKRSDFYGHASYGYCASLKLHYFGYKLVCLTTLEGIPVIYELVPAHTDERLAAEAVLARLQNRRIYGDKGFLGAAWQTLMFEENGHQIFTFKRTNQKQQNSPTLNTFLGKHRSRIESTFNCLQNTGRFLDRLFAKSIQGLCTRIAAKMSAWTLTLVLAQHFGINVRTFEIA
jgi:hypothetical protein